MDIEIADIRALHEIQKNKYCKVCLTLIEDFNPDTHTDHDNNYVCDDCKSVTQAKKE